MKTDLVVLSGQSNMAGRGDAAQAPLVPTEAGWEYKAIGRSGVYPVKEPFGFDQNRTGGIDDQQKKTGSMVSAFINAYFATCHVPVIGISASQGGTGIDQWLPGKNMFADLSARIRKAKADLPALGYSIDRTILLWMQGETDADHEMSGEEYSRKLALFTESIFQDGVTDFFLIPIGCYNGEESRSSYEMIRQAQISFSLQNEKVKTATMLASTYKAKGWMKDAFHYDQRAYNEMGWDAGINAAKERMKQYDTRIKGRGFA